MIQSVSRVKADDELEDVRDTLRRCMHKINGIIGTDKTYLPHDVAWKVVDAGNKLEKAMRERNVQVREVRG